MRLHLSRWVCTGVDANLRRMAEESDRAADGGADLCVFPESFLHGYSQTVDPTLARSSFSAISARQAGTAFAFGSFTEERRNRMTLWLGGREVARYDKVHLFAPNGEFDIWEPGDTYASVRLGEWTVGLLNCNDVRFPEQARSLRLEHRCDLLLAVAWWPWRRDRVWSALLRARAIENAAFCAGCCISACDAPSERFSGAGNHVFDPAGDPVPTRDDNLYFLDRKRFEQVVVDPLDSWVDVRRRALFEPGPSGSEDV